MMRNGVAIARRMNTRKLSNNASTYSSSSTLHNKYSAALFEPKQYLDFNSINEEKDIIPFFHNMIRMKPIPSDSAFSKFLSLVIRMRHYRIALHLFDEMRHSSIPLSDISLNILINCYCLVTRVDLGFAILGTLLKRGFVPTITTFNTLIKGLFLVNKVAEAEILFKKLVREKLCKPDGFTFATVMNGLCKAGGVHTALNLLSMLDNPCVYAYSPIIDSLCRQGMVDDARLLFSKMIDNGISPNVVTYTSLIKGFCDICRWKDAKELLNDMIATKIPPDVITYNTVIDAFCKEGMMKEAEGVIEIMMQRNVAPTIVTYTSLIDGYCMRGEMEEARKVFSLLRQSGLNPCIVSYSSLMNGYCKKGDVDEAWKLFLEIPCVGLEYNTICYSTMLHGLLRAGRIADGWELFNKMRVQHHAIPNLVTYNSLIDGLCRDELFAQAFSVLSMMEDNCINPNIVTYNAFIHGLCQVGKLDVAMDLLSLLTSKGLLPSVITFNIIILALCKEGRLDEAQGMFVEMGNCCCVPDSTAYNALVQTCIKQSDFDRAKLTLVEMLNKGFSINAATLSLFLRCSREDGRDGDLRDLIMKLVPKHKMRHANQL